MPCWFRRKKGTKNELHKFSHFARRCIFNLLFYKISRGMEKLDMNICTQYNWNMWESNILYYISQVQPKRYFCFLEDKWAVVAVRRIILYSLSTFILKKISPPKILKGIKLPFTLMFGGELVSKAKYLGRKVFPSPTNDMVLIQSLFFWTNFGSVSDICSMYLGCMTR